ncbi:hexosaminidase D-like [Amblyomma americanum]
MASVALAALLAVLVPQATLAVMNVIPPHRLVHLDLKGAPPKASYLIRLIPTLKRLGATGLLVEYEDSFPFVGEPLHALASPRAYTRQDLRSILDTARDNGLTIVPLINTFDKLEYILKHPQFAKYREIPTDPSTMCPSNPAGVKLIQDILDQILHFHHAKDLYYVHIGCGDVAALGMCKRCTARRFDPADPGSSSSSRRFGRYDRYMLYMSYVQLITDYLKENYGVKTIVWHDTLAKIPNELYRMLPVHLHVEVMVATYRTDLEFSSWLNFASRFGNSLWMATSFKEVGDVTAVYPRLKQRIQSHANWIGAMREWREHVRFPGVALMGPQRISHDSPLRELLPVSLPSLALCLAMVRKAGELPALKNGSSPVEILLGCNRTIRVDDDSNMQGMGCKFPGSAIVNELGNLETLRRHLDLLPYLPRCKPESAKKLESLKTSESEDKDCIKNLHSQLAELSALNVSLRRALEEVYSREIADEYATARITAVMADIKQKQAILDSSGSLNVFQSTVGARYKMSKWPRRAPADPDEHGAIRSQQ